MTQATARTASAVTAPSAAAGSAEAEAGTRRRVLDIIVADGPISAAELAARLDLTAAAVRRHLVALQESRQVVAHTVRPVGPARRGRPAKRYVVTAEGQTALSQRYAELAEQALHFVARTVGESALLGFAELRASELQARLAGALPAAESGGVGARLAAVAEALSQDGYAATVRPVPGTAIVQLCQGHCPVQDVASEFPQLCEAETRVLARVLGVPVQRLATLAGGGHACTTSIPTRQPVPSAEGNPE